MLLGRSSISSVPSGGTRRRSLSAAVPGTTDDDADITEVVLPGASAFTEQAMLLARVAPPRHGWRRGLYVVSRGRLNLGPSAAERREQAMIARIRTRVRSPRRIVVLSRKGGAGKTTTALMLGTRSRRTAVTAWSRSMPTLTRGRWSTACTASRRRR